MVSAFVFTFLPPLPPRQVPGTKFRLCSGGDTKSKFRYLELLCQCCRSWLVRQMWCPIITKKSTTHTTTASKPVKGCDTSSVWNPHHPVDNGVLKGQLEVVGSAAIEVNNRTDGVAPLSTLWHHQLLPIDPDFLQYDISRNVSQVDTEQLVITHGLYRKRYNSEDYMSRSSSNCLKSEAKSEGSALNLATPKTPNLWLQNGSPQTNRWRHIHLFYTVCGPNTRLIQNDRNIMAVDILIQFWKYNIFTPFRDVTFIMNWFTYICWLSY